MNSIIVEFSSDLLKFTKRRGFLSVVEFDISKKSSVKDIIESCGVPHVEVTKILCKNKELSFSYLPKEGDEIFVFGVQKPLNVNKKSILRPYTFDAVKFAADANVGKAAVLLRALGFDTFYEPCAQDFLIADLAYEEDRIVVTRDIDLLKRKKIVYGMFIDSNEPFVQTKLILERFGIKDGFKLFSRCTRCNSRLNPVEKKDIEHRLLPKTKLYYNKFYFCPVCEKVYWEGSHKEKIIDDFKKVGIYI